MSDLRRNYWSSVPVLRKSQHHNTWSPCSPPLRPGECWPPFLLFDENMKPIIKLVCNMTLVISSVFCRLGRTELHCQHRNSPLSLVTLNLPPDLQYHSHRETAGKLSHQPRHATSHQNLMLFWSRSLNSQRSLQNIFVLGLLFSASLPLCPISCWEICQMSAYVYKDFCSPNRGSPSEEPTNRKV